MFILTLALLAMAYGFKGKEGKINRVEGAILVICYIAEPLADSHKKPII